MKMKTLTSTLQHERMFQEVIAVVRKYSDNMSSEEMLAVFANITGKVLAMQDQRTMTVPMAMEIIAQNIEAGNQQMQEELSKPKGNA